MNASFYFTISDAFCSPCCLLLLLFPQQSFFLLDFSHLIFLNIEKRIAVRYIPLKPFIGAKQCWICVKKKKKIFSSLIYCHCITFVPGVPCHILSFLYYIVVLYCCTTLLHFLFCCTVLPFDIVALYHRKWRKYSDILPVWISWGPHTQTLPDVVSYSPPPPSHPVTRPMWC